MVKPCAVLMILAQFTSPVLASLIPLALLVTAPSILLVPVSSDLPKLAGIPLSMTFIEHEITHGRESETKVISSEVEQHMKQWGVDQLNEYCKLLKDKGAEEKFLAECGHVNQAFSAIHAEFHYNWQEHFKDPNVIENLKKYLNKIKENMKNNMGVIKDTYQTILKDGWNEMKEFCNDNQTWKNKKACQFVKNKVETGTSRGPTRK